MTPNQEMWVTLAILFVFYSAHLRIDWLLRRVKELEEKRLKGPATTSLISMARACAAG